MTDKVIPMPQSKKPGKQPLISARGKRDLAKFGMVAAMGTLVATGFMSRQASRLHISSGLALIGFSLWHWSLYQPKSQSR